MLSANTGLCSKVRPIFLIVEVNFALRMRSGNLSKWFYIKNHQLTNLNMGGKFQACIRNSTILYNY